MKIGNEFRQSDVVGNVFRHHAAMKGASGRHRTGVSIRPRRSMSLVEIKQLSEPGSHGIARGGTEWARCG